MIGTRYPGEATSRDASIARLPPVECPFCGSKEIVPRKPVAHNTTGGTRSVPRFHRPEAAFFCECCKRVLRRVKRVFQVNAGKRPTP